jgi:hypothetical protein
MGRPSQGVAGAELGYTVRQIIECRSVAVVTGAILVIAALLKSNDFATLPADRQWIANAKWLLAAITVSGELLLGLLLLLDVAPRAINTVAIACFLAFTCVSAYGLARGEDSCGCFGQWSPPPWVTLIMDALIVVGLVNRHAYLPALRLRHRRLILVIVAYLLIAVPVGTHIILFRPGQLQSDGTVLFEKASHNTVFLEPERWVGGPFPLFSHIVNEDAESLRKGTWRVLLYHHDCKKCQRAIESLRNGSTGAPQEQLALIELPPYGGDIPTISHTTFRHVHLSDRWKWFAETPIELTLHDGIVY